MDFIQELETKRLSYDLIIDDMESMLDRRYISVINDWANLLSHHRNPLDYGVPALLPTSSDDIVDIYFCTMAFSTNKVVSAIKKEWKTITTCDKQLPKLFRTYTQSTVQVDHFVQCKWETLMPSEQYKFLNYHLNKYLPTISSDYYLFFESTNDGNLHCHFLIKSNSDVHSFLKGFHRYFDEPIRNPYFMKNGLKKFNSTMWNDYNNKKVKQYQTLNKDVYVPIVMGSVCLSYIK